MIKHVGKHNQRKIAIVYRTIPEEEHMALVIYTEALPSMIHDEAMKVLESEVGQQAKELADALFRHTMADGQNCLTAIHKAGYMKKVPTNQVIVTPTKNSTIRLDQLNEMMTKIEAGGDAADRLKELDENAGLGKDPVKTRSRDVGESVKATKAQTDVNTSTPDVLTDDILATQRLEQAAKMKAEANSLLAEAKRLEAEAKSLAPKAANVRKTRTTKKATA